MQISGLYYEHMTIVNDDSSVISKWSFKLIDDPIVVIYERHRFIIQATALSLCVYFDLYVLPLPPWTQCSEARQVIRLQKRSAKSDV